MKALIFNSGYGKRMGEFTKKNHKSMARLSNGESIFERQLRILGEHGIRDIVITTGSFSSQLKEVCSKGMYSDYNFVFVENEKFLNTNYIYSMYLAKEYLDDDFFVLHGDLVFNRKLVKKILRDPRSDLALVNKKMKLPDKDFKARLEGDMIRKISVSIFDKECYTFQPLYKLRKQTIDKWVSQVCAFVSSGNVEVYAEDALNNILNDENLSAFYYDSDYASEVDNMEDLERVSEEIRQYDFDEQIMHCGDEFFYEIKNFLKINKIDNPMLVYGSSYQYLQVKEYISSLKRHFVTFSGYSPNPKYEEIKQGVALYKEQKCDGIIAIGGGSAIDTAKCIKLFSMLSMDGIYLEQEYIYSPIKILAIPTTAGTGSEATHFSVLYYNDEKQSITHDCILPEQVLLLPSNLKSLPEYQKKCTLMDALCQCMESIWSVNSNDLSYEYALKGIRLIIENYEDYIMNKSSSYELIMKGAYYSGKAINISKTTAVHAMSYKLSTTFGIPHGHAVALCMPHIWRYMYSEIKGDFGQTELLKKFKTISLAFGCKKVEGGIAFFEKMICELKLDRKFTYNQELIETLVNSVNPMRLANNPVVLEKAVIRELYLELFEKRKT